MKSQSYMTRALKARDPRFARILGRLGYATADMTDEAAALPEPEIDIAVLRGEYERAVGKRPFNGWDAAELRKRMTAVE